MNNYQELFQEIKKALADNDQSTLNILLQDQQSSLLQKILAGIEDADLKSRFSDYLVRWNDLNQQRKTKVQSQDKIRKINVGGEERDKQESEQDIVEQQIKRKKLVKIQQKSGYAFYGNVKCLMKSYGDLTPIEQSVKMMHSEIHILFQLVFKFISKIEESEKINQSSLKKLIEVVFKDECECFEKITKQYKKATKSTKNKEQVYQSSSDQNEFPDENKMNPSSHMNANTFEQSKYLASITKNMTQEQYQSYSECRSINFLQNNKSSKSAQDLNKFVKFLDPSQQILKPNMRLLELLSFICCRFIRKIIFEIKRMNNGGQLEQNKEPITSEEIKKIGNHLLEGYEKQFESMKDSKQNVTNDIKDLFISDFQNSEFKTAFPRKYTSSNKSPEQIWNENSHYRQMWSQRFKGENQIQERITEIEKEQFEPFTQYGKFIVKNFDTFKKRGSVFLWKKYFTQERIVEEPEKNIQTGGRPRKRVKLQSLQQQK